MSDEQMRELIANAVERAITQRTAPDHPFYFVEDQWLVTFGWLSTVTEPMQQRIAALEQRLARLERPWWRRWLSR